MAELQAKIVARTNTREGIVRHFLSEDALSVFNKTQYTILPGFCDVHVHFREPGFSYKEDIRTGTSAAAHGGYTAVCTMPNLNPVPDSPEHLAPQSDAIARGAVVGVYPYGAITVGERGEALADMAGLAPDVIAFSDDGRGLQEETMMRAAMREAKRLNKPIVAHCEVNSLLNGGYIHDGVYAREHGHRGISAESEYLQVERDLRLARETGCAYHVCHISTRESVELIRRAKRAGVNVTCETAPHYLVMDENDLREDGRFKMNPPLRAREDRLALLAGVRDGTIDMIATDHAPHAAEEKAKGLSGSAFGVVGLETAFSVLYTRLVCGGILTLDKLLDLLVDRPRERFNIPLGLDYSIWDLGAEYRVDPQEFLSKGRATPFEGQSLTGRCVATVYGGKRVW